MTPAEAQMLLGIAASFDNRKPSEESAVAWSYALDGYRFEDCRDAIVAHYRVSSDWLMPQRVISEVKRIRGKRIADAGDLTPPPDLTPLETIAWLKDSRRRIGDGENLADHYGELTKRHLPDLLRVLPSPHDEPAHLCALRDEATADLCGHGVQRVACTAHRAETEPTEEIADA